MEIGLKGEIEMCKSGRINGKPHATVEKNTLHKREGRF
jgi:hypothetical protein